MKYLLFTSLILIPTAFTFGNNYICKRCAEEFRSVSNSISLDCPRAPKVRKKEPDQYRSRAEAERLLGPRAGMRGSKWQKPSVNMVNGSISNIQAVDPRWKIKGAVNLVTGSSSNEKEKIYLAKKLKSYYVIKGRSWYEYPLGRGHDLIKK